MKMKKIYKNHYLYYETAGLYVLAIDFEKFGIDMVRGKTKKAHENRLEKNIGFALNHNDLIVKDDKNEEKGKMHSMW
jgi:hypothetical protein